MNQSTANQSQSVIPQTLMVSWKEVYETIDQDRLEKISLCPFFSRAGVTVSNKQIDKKYLAIFFAFIERIIINYSIDYLDDICKFMDQKKAETNCIPQIDQILSFFQNLKSKYITPQISLTIEEFNQLRFLIFQLIENDQLFNAFVPFALVYLQSLLQSANVNILETYEKDNVQKLCNILRMNIKVIVSKPDKITIHANKSYQDSKQKFDKTIIIVDKNKNQTINIGYDCSNERLHRFCYQGKIIYQNNQQSQMNSQIPQQVSQIQSQITLENSALKERIQAINNENIHQKDENIKLKEGMQLLSLEQSKSQNEIKQLNNKIQIYKAEEQKLAAILDQLLKVSETILGEQSKFMDTLQQSFSQNQNTIPTSHNQQQQVIHVNSAILKLKQSLQSIISTQVALSKPQQQGLQSQTNSELEHNVYGVNWLSEQTTASNFQQSQLIQNLNTQVVFQQLNKPNTTNQANNQMNTQQSQQTNQHQFQFQQSQQPYQQLQQQSINLNNFNPQSQSMQHVNPAIQTHQVQGAKSDVIQPVFQNSIAIPQLPPQSNPNNRFNTNLQQPSLNNDQNNKKSNTLQSNQALGPPSFQQNNNKTMFQYGDSGLDVHTIKVKKANILPFNDDENTGKWTVHKQIENNRKKNEQLVCEICCSTKDSEQFIQLKCCHQFCYECLLQHINSLIDEGKRSFDNFTCLYCSFKFDPLYLISYLTDKQRSQIDDYYQNRIINFKCPNPKCCQQQVIQEKECILKEMFITVCCKTKVCSKCKQVYHPDTQCESQIKEIISQIGSYRDQQPTDNAKLFRFCPFCFQFAFKDEGCDHVKCIKCKCDFCFYCSAPRPSILGHGNHYHRAGCHYFSEYEDRKGVKYDNQFDVKACSQCNKTKKPCKRPISWNNFLDQIKKEVGPDILEAFPDNFII